MLCPSTLGARASATKTTFRPQVICLATRQLKTLNGMQISTVKWPTCMKKLSLRKYSNRVNSSAGSTWCRQSLCSCLVAHGKLR